MCEVITYTLKGGELMILLKANNELKNVFQKLINTVGVRVNWNGIFIINNDNLMLLGENASWLFNFESKKIFTDIVDMQIDEAEIAEITNNANTLTNVINMILYVFGKWDKLSGIKVKDNYAHLNDLFRGILSEVSVEPDFTDEYFRFYDHGVRLTYEDVIQMILDVNKSIVSLEKAENGNGKDTQNGDELGLWHNVKWRSGVEKFAKDDK